MINKSKFLTQVCISPYLTIRVQGTVFLMNFSFVLCLFFSICPKTNQFFNLINFCSYRYRDLCDALATSNFFCPITFFMPLTFCCCVIVVASSTWLLRFTSITCKLLSQKRDHENIKDGGGGERNSDDILILICTN